MKGITGLEEHLKDVERKLAEKTAEPWESYDLMKMYRNSIKEEESDRIMAEVYEKNIQTKAKRNSKNKIF